MVSAFMPESAAKLIRILLKIKADSDATKPLLGFKHESIHFRSSHYIYPATQAIKALFGPKIRFHHLRHGGVELLYLQGLHLVYQRQGSRLSSTLQSEATEAMLCEKSCLARFDFWLEGRPLHELNTGLLLDIVAKQCGHSSYSTTRRHYFYTAWKKQLQLLKPAYHQYSRAELRYLFDIPVGSNDISHIFENSLIPEYSLLSDKYKKQFQPELTESEIIKKLKLKLSVCMGRTSTATNKQTSTLDKCDFASILVEFIT